MAWPDLDRGRVLGRQAGEAGDRLRGGNSLPQCGAIPRLGCCPLSFPALPRPSHTPRGQTLMNIGGGPGLPFTTQIKLYLDDGGDREEEEHTDLFV